MDGIELQVMICTYGEEGIRRVAQSAHPAVPGVEYLVSWQTDGRADIPEALQRPDFRIVMTDTKGLSANRNNALANATAPLLLVSDDDADYSEEGLAAVIKAFGEYPDCGLLTFKYASAKHEKDYPSHGFSLDRVPKGYFVSSLEIAFRREAVQGKIWFNEFFGIGAMFPSGEEDVFLRDCTLAGLIGRFVPEVIARHDGSTTSDRNKKSVSMPQTKGAVFLHLHPFSWPLRMMAHISRQFGPWRRGAGLSPYSYGLNWLKGAWKAKTKGVFNKRHIESHG